MHVIFFVLIAAVVAVLGYKIVVSRRATGPFGSRTHFTMR
jgi:hypothetical protein